METPSGDPQKTAAKTVSMHGNSGQQFPPMETVSMETEMETVGNHSSVSGQDQRLARLQLTRADEAFFDF